MKSLLRKLLMLIPLNFNQNITYDRQARSIIRKCTSKHSNCVDVGCHKGEFLDLFLKYCPDGHHIAFEPIPSFYRNLVKKYGEKADVRELCLSDDRGKNSFVHVVSNPAYSGILKRNFDRSGEKVEKIEVFTDTLDNVMDENAEIDFVKIDVEGAEYKVLKGATQTLKRCRAVIVFEFGLGAADVYRTTPDMMYDLLCVDLGMQVGLLSRFLKNRENLSRAQFNHEFYSGNHYYFVAWPIQQ